MEKETFDYIAQRAQVLATTPAAKQATAAAAQAWLDATADADDVAVEGATAELLDYLEGKPNTIDGVIAFAESPMAAQMMGEDGAKAFLAKQLDRKASGARYCDCPACTAATEIQAKMGRIEL